MSQCDFILDLDEEMTITETTLGLYPKMAKAGWCFSGNVNKVDVEKDCDKKLYAQNKIASYSHMKADATIIGLGYDAYWSDGYCDPKMLPTFVRVNKKEFLDELGFEERVFTDVMAECIIVKKFEVSRFELMELVEEVEVNQ